MLNREVKKYVGNTFFDFHGDFDMMSYLDQDVPGCSLPQMYFKTAGCWTGGHQENVSMSALNINHGPDYSEWYTLDLKYVEDLRTELKQGIASLYPQSSKWIFMNLRDCGMRALIGLSAMVILLKDSFKERMISW